MMHSYEHLPSQTVFILVNIDEALFQKRPGRHGVHVKAGTDLQILAKTG
jgi:hypothetical protein